MSDPQTELTSPPTTHNRQVPDYGGDNIDYSPHFNHEENFPTLEAAIEWATGVAEGFGFFLTIAGHKTRTNGNIDYYMCCDRYKNKGSRNMEIAMRRHTKRIGVECRFKLKIVSRGPMWLIKVVKGGGTHNHQLMVYKQGHRQVSKLIPAGMKLVGDMSSTQVKSGRIMKAINIQLPVLNPAMRHIYNCREWLRRKKIKDKNPGDGNELCDFPYRKNVPTVILDYIIDWNDVVADGNCGFRCVADALYNGQDMWDVVRRALANELVVNSCIYHPIYGGIEEVGAAAAWIEWEGSRCREEHYMEVVADLFPIATLYRVAIMCFLVNPLKANPDYSVTVLSLTIGNRHNHPFMELTIAHLGTYKHYIRLHLDHDFPVPPISPQWYHQHDRSVNGWDALYAPRRARWDALVGRLRPLQH